MLTCAVCGEENPERAKFCLDCGAPLAQEPQPARMERKFATALFADLVGSTTLAEREDPEVVQSVVGRTFDRLSQEIERYGGHLEKFMGDAVLAVFGIPRTHEDDPERAVRAGLEMQAVLSELNRGFEAEGKPQLEMRIGIEAGEVLVDLERATGPRDRMLTGDAVNTAARLQTAAEPGHVVVGPGVYASVKDVIHLAELAPLVLKGKTEPVAAWDARAVIAKRRGERPALGLQARLIGRDEELTVLKQTLQRVDSEGRSALVTIVGPAGVGKSRLIHELGAYTEGLPSFFYWRNGRCLAYGNTSYSALADAVKAQCEVLEDDSVGTVRTKVDAAVLELFDDLEVSPAITALVTAGERSLSREDLFDAWRRFFERMAARYPLVLVLEDIHWADDGLLDFIEHMADWAQGSLMVITLARPELFDRRPTWGGGKRNATTISLDPLTPDEDAAMVDELLPGVLSDELRATIVERAEGNPLYTEEIVRMLVDRGVLRATEASRWEVAAPITDVELPRSIQGLIAARLDGLPDDEKNLLQDAAVVGREFWLGSVVTLTGLEPGAARDVLGRLRVKELIVPHEPSSFRGEQEFSFRHLLLRDGAYDSLPKQLRAEKHAGVAAWAAERAGERADEMAELIATHALEAVRYRAELGDTGEASQASMHDAYRWARAAGDRTAELWLPAEALLWYGKAMSLAETLEVPLDERVSLARARSTASTGTADTEEQGAIARSYLDLAERSGNAHDAGAAESTLAILAFELGHDDEAQALLRSSIDRLEPLGDSAELAKALRTSGWYRWRRGLPAEAEPLLRRAVEMATRVDAPVVVAESMIDLGVTLTMLGEKDDAIRVMEDAYRLAKESRDFSTMMRVCVNYPAVISQWTSDMRKGYEVTAEGVDLARKAGGTQQLGWLLGNLADFILMSGSIEDAVAVALEAVKLAEQIGDEPLLCMRLAGYGLMLTEAGRTDDAAQALDRASGVLGTNPEPQSESLIRHGRGLLASLCLDPAEAAAQLRAGVDVVRAFNDDTYPELHPPLVRALVELDDREAAAAYRLTARARSPYAIAMGLVVDGILEPDPHSSARILTEAVERLGTFPVWTEQGRALLDLAFAQSRAGDDPGATLDRAHDVFSSHGILGWLPHVEAARATLTTERSTL
ncbi:MAG: AAA family ATPase [Actinomycetota bacterium]|nr:AAA family ATPase [Actinomycetota bacterium]